MGNPAPAASDLYLRKWQLVVSTGGQGLDLSEMHLKFMVRQKDMQTLNNATIRVYNLADSTAQQIEQEFTKVTLSAGYITGNFGVIFQGTIIQVRRGRENPTDKYLDIIAADGDEDQISAIVNTGLAKGSTFTDRINAIAKSMPNVKVGYVAEMPPDKLPRGTTLYGAARDRLDDIAQSTGTRWSIQGGVLQFISIEGYLPGEAVVLNSQTGLVGFPEQTADGIAVKCLLNPKIKLSGRVQVDEKSVQQAVLNQTLAGSAQNTFLPSIASDGFYRTIVIEYEGDTRGQPWYSDLTLVKLGENVPPSQVQRGRGVY
jgi:hypothetical protein